MTAIPFLPSLGDLADALGSFLQGLKQHVHPNITEPEAMEMLRHYLMTKPVFSQIFAHYPKVKNNPLSILLDQLPHGADITPTDELYQLYRSAKRRAQDMEATASEQTVITDLFENFLKAVSPKMVAQLGIVYTPVEIVDFIIYSTEQLFQQEFNQSLSDPDVHLLDPFTGTGIFITRLLQSGLIQAQDLRRKYTRELHANELVLLSYYIACINIEKAYHEALQPPATDFQPFGNIVLTDTFQLSDSDAMGSLFPQPKPRTSPREELQKKQPVQVIMGNPPYSVGQKSANDMAQNQSYPQLHKRITETYVEQSDARNTKSLYDSYFKAFRWASDRLDKEKGGIIAFVTGGGWIDGHSASGFRKTLSKEFSAIYVLNLRGNARTRGEICKKEGGKVFGQGSRTPIAITFLIKKPHCKASPRIYYHDIGDYLSEKEKLSILRDFKHVKALPFIQLEPNEAGDWINQRNPFFDTFIPLRPEKKDSKTQSYFNTYALGIKTSRDAWVYNFSKKQLEKNMRSTIGFYNQETWAYQKALQENKNLKIEAFVNMDSSKISWSHDLIKKSAEGKYFAFESKYIVTSLYRPFCKKRLYVHKPFIEKVRLGSFFPHEGIENFVICISGLGKLQGLSVLISKKKVDGGLTLDSNCFPLYYYENPSSEGNLFDPSFSSSVVRRDGISDSIFNQARELYDSTSITKKDIFYYVYGVLHSPDYRSTFSNDFKKRLPRIPLVNRAELFWAIRLIGKQLADLHLNYEDGAPYPYLTVDYKDPDSPMDYTVEKMRFAKNRIDGVLVADKTTIIYNDRITISGIPSKAYAYTIGGKSAIWWVMNQYQIKTDSASQLCNNPNHWAQENGKPRYILDLLLSVIRVSVETLRLQETLPKVSAFFPNPKSN